MHLEHVVITRFCLRSYFRGYSSDLSKFGSDPWNNDLLRRRLKLIKMVSGPSLVRQTNHCFAWVIVTEADLPDGLRRHLLDCFRDKERVFIKPYTGPAMFADTSWLADCFEKKPDYLLTTSMDDDDMLSANYVDVLQRTVRDEYDTGTLPYIKVYGVSNYREWTIVPERGAPLGRVNPHNNTWRFPTTGLSLVIKHRALNWTSAYIDHVHVESYLNNALDPATGEVDFFRRRMKQQLSQAGLSGSVKLGPHLVKDLADCRCAVVMTNHLDNLRKSKLFRPVLAPEVVTRSSFDGFGLDWDLVEQEIPSFRPGLPLLYRHYLRRADKKVQAAKRGLRSILLR